MQLFTRLITEGIFIFWSGENTNDYNLKISIFNGNNKIKILDTNLTKEQCFYTLKNVGSGEYEIELNAYKAEKLIQTEVKKVKLASASEGMMGLLDKLTEICDELSTHSDELEHISSKLSAQSDEIENASSKLSEIVDFIKYPTSLDSYEYAAFKEAIIRRMR